MIRRFRRRRLERLLSDREDLNFDIAEAKRHYALAVLPNAKFALAAWLGDLYEEHTRLTKKIDRLKEKLS